MMNQLMVQSAIRQGESLLEKGESMARGEAEMEDTEFLSTTTYNPVEACREWLREYNEWQYDISLMLKKFSLTPPVNTTGINKLPPHEQAEKFREVVQSKIEPFRNQIRVLRDKLSSGKNS